MGGNFRFQVQDSFLEYFFWRLGDLEKQIALSEKKPPLWKCYAAQPDKNCPNSEELKYYFSNLSFRFLNSNYYLQIELLQYIRIMKPPGIS